MASTVFGIAGTAASALYGFAKGAPVVEILGYVAAGGGSLFAMGVALDAVERIERVADRAIQGLIITFISGVLCSSFVEFARNCWGPLENNAIKSTCLILTPILYGSFASFTVYKMVHHALKPPPPKPRPSRWKHVQETIKHAIGAIGAGKLVAGSVVCCVVNPIVGGAIIAGGTVVSITYLVVHIFKR